MLVPIATNTMAVTESLIPNVQPKCDATSPIIAVTTPILKMETTKHRYPPAISTVVLKKIENILRWFKIAIEKLLIVLVSRSFRFLRLL